MPNNVNGARRSSSHERRVITFDLYGCLLNFRLVPHFVGQVGRENNINPELTEYFFHLYLNRVMYAMDFMNYHDVLATTMAYIDMEFNTKVFTQNFNELYLIHNDLVPHNDVLPVLHALREKGYELYILGNTDMTLMRKQFDRLDGIFDEKTVLVADEPRCYKPRFDFMRKAVDKFKLRSALHFHVSDNYFQDIIPASQLHWMSVYVNRSKTGVYKGIEPSVVINTLSDLEGGMAYALKRIEEEEAAARARENAERQAAEQKAAEQKAKAEETAHVQRAAQQQMQQQRHQQQQYESFNINDDMMEFGNATITEQDRILNEKMKHMNPARARALAKARERAARMRDI